ncbi:MAG: non-ribosomal peptide synthetase [Clostridia bacterium]|nr:non-ribosomal peptide synthetase [Clostridia bacterium]
MRVTNLGGARTINEYVRKKLLDFERSEKCFETLFRLMFRESDNIISEESRGFKVIKTTYGEAKRNSLLLSKAVEAMMPDLVSKEGAVCGIYMENSLLWIEIFWALVIAGVKPLLMNLLLDKRSLKKAAGSAACGHIICDRSKLQSFSDEFKDFNIVCAGDLLEKTKEYCDEEPALSGKPFANEIIFMTSGTTENVKLCYYGADRFFHQISYSFEIIKKNRLTKRHYRGELKLLAFLPFYHIFGFVAVYLWFGFFSRTFVFLSDLSPETLTNTVRRRHVTHIFAVPLFWNKVFEGAMRKINSMGEETAARFRKGMRIAEKIYGIPIIGSLLGNAFSKAAFKPVRRKLFGGSISFMISGGGAVREDVLEFFNLIGYRLMNGFGMTETGIASVELSKNVKQVLKGLVGRPLDKVEYKIEGGELFIKGQVVASYIVENGVRKELPEWFPTKDMAAKEGKGYRILGRADDLIVPQSGENINPDIVEKYLYTNGVVTLCALRDGQGAAIVAEIEEGLTDERIAEIRDEISRNALSTPLRGMISKIILTSESLIPEGDFKVSRKKLARSLESGEIRDVTDKSRRKKSGTEIDPSDTVLIDVINIIAEAKGIDVNDIGPDSDLFGELGFSSLDFIEVLSGLSVKYSGTMPVGYSGEKITPRFLRDEILKMLEEGVREE